MSVKRRVCVVTATRSEYGLLRWLIEHIQEDDELILQLLVTGSHLSPEHGFTCRQIEEDGYVIDERIEMLLSGYTDTGIVKSMGICSIGIADAFKRLSPDIIIVLGDRYELLPVCSAALVMNIPVGHISGGDITEGAIDDKVRNAVTMMASLHFPGVRESAERICRMIGTDKNVWESGEPGLENFIKLSLLDRKRLGDELQVEFEKKWVLLSFHPETRRTVDENLQMIGNTIEVLNQMSGIRVIMTKANSDLGGGEINAYLQEIASLLPEKYKLYSSLGQLKYLSLMKEVECLIGNSSSGIVEAPFIGTPVINIGGRQSGRYMCGNIVSVPGDKQEIRCATACFLGERVRFAPDTYYGDGQSARKIMNHIKQFLKENV